MSSQNQVKPKPNDHLANERTFLAWIRTSIALIGFGFVIVKFSLFLEQVSQYIEQELDLPEIRYSSIVGVIMVAVGVGMAVLAYWQFNKIKNQLNSDSFKPSRLLAVILAITLIAGGLVLLFYLISLPNVR